MKPDNIFFNIYRFGNNFRHCLFLLIILLFASCGTGRNAVSRGKYNQQKGKEKIELPQSKITHDNYPSIDKNRRAIVDEARSWLGTKYQYGGHSKKGTDCSGLVMEVYLKIINLKLPRASWEQQAFCQVINFDALRPGDLVFFSPGGKYQVSHVGIYIGNNQMIHASPSRGVMISNLAENYFQRNYHSSGLVRQLKNTKLPQTEQVNIRDTETPIRKAGEISLDDLNRILDQKTDSILSSFMD